METLKEFTIPRDKWMRGSVGTLWNSQLDCGCVLGHYLLACGVEKEDLDGEISPGGVFGWDSTSPFFTLFTPVEACLLPIVTLEDTPIYGKLLKEKPVVSAAMTTNDNARISPEARETSLKEIFAGVGVELNFIDTLEGASE